MHICAVVVCPELLDPDNGQVQLSDVVFESTATYSCDTGYNLNGSVSRMCMADGQWNGEDPTCQSKGQYHHHWFVCVCACVCVFVLAHVYWCVCGVDLHVRCFMTTILQLLTVEIWLLLKMEC